MVRALASLPHGSSGEEHLQVTLSTVTLEESHTPGA